MEHACRMSHYCPVLCCALLCSVVLCCALLCSVVLCCVLLCSVVFCWCSVGPKLDFLGHGHAGLWPLAVSRPVPKVAGSNPVQYRCEFHLHGICSIGLGKIKIAVRSCSMA